MILLLRTHHATVAPLHHELLFLSTVPLFCWNLSTSSHTARNNSRPSPHFVSSALRSLVSTMIAGMATTRRSNFVSSGRFPVLSFYHGNGSARTSSSFSSFPFACPCSLRRPCAVLSLRTLTCEGWREQQEAGETKVLLNSKFLNVRVETPYGTHNHTGYDHITHKHAHNHAFYLA